MFMAVIHPFTLADGMKASLCMGFMTIVIPRRWRKPVTFSFPVTFEKLLDDPRIGNLHILRFIVNSGKIGVEINYHRYFRDSDSTELMNLQLRRGKKTYYYRIVHSEEEAGVDDLPKSVSKWWNSPPDRSMHWSPSKDSWGYDPAYWRYRKWRGY